MRNVGVFDEKTSFSHMRLNLLNSKYIRIFSNQGDQNEGFYLVTVEGSETLKGGNAND